MRSRPWTRPEPVEARTFDKLTAHSPTSGHIRGPQRDSVRGPGDGVQPIIHSGRVDDRPSRAGEGTPTLAVAHQQLARAEMTDQQGRSVSGCDGDGSGILGVVLKPGQSRVASAVGRGGGCVEVHSATTPSA